MQDPRLALGWATVPLYLGSEVIAKFWINIPVYYELISILKFDKIAWIIFTLSPWYFKYWVIINSQSCHDAFNLGIGASADFYKC